MSAVAPRDLSEEIESRWGVVYVPLLRDWLGSGETAWLPLTGSSMKPFLAAGARILVSGAAVDRISRGDLIVYEHEGAIVCHRVLDRRVRAAGAAILTKGDGWRTPASWISASQLVGRVVGVEWDGGRTSFETAGRRLQAQLIARCSSLVVSALPLLRRARGLLERSWRCA